ncbi:glycosyltransferase [uncultured Pontibacter sp.]|uniref:glycosyltransferase n=1 Tax=uncultured Pontibacter sp. TaxID=453356 RepID=UPI0026318363|nr:glycosyltransferase [uncultured Pontibacter sp.]
MREGVSIVICTYNGAALLPETIRHIAQQRVDPKISWELVVIDNASTDNTSEIAVTEWRKHGSPAPFILLQESKQGLTYARALALQEAQYDFVLFCDDDNWLEENYVNLAYQCMMQHPRVGALGGHGTLVFETPPPVWAKGHGLFANGPQAKASGIVPNHIVYGAGCVIRKTAYNKLIQSGFKPTLTDRKGGKLSSGGDYELCYAIALAGYSIWYERKLTFRHFMPSSRIRWEFYKRFIKEGLQCYEVIVPYRLRVSMGAKNLFSFYAKAMWILLSYILRLFPVLFHKFKSRPGSDMAEYYSLKLYSLKHKIFIFRKINSMRQSFLEILEFEEQNLGVTRFSKLPDLSSQLNKIRTLLVR